MESTQNFKVARVAAAITLLLGGCAMSPGYHMDESKLVAGNAGQAAAADDRKYVVTMITPAVVAQENGQLTDAQAVQDNRLLTTTVTDYHYIIEPDDVINVTVFNHPELAGVAGSAGSVGTAAASAGGDQPVAGAAGPAGYLVNKDGLFRYPFVGQVRAAGRTTGEIRELLTRELAPYIRNPQIFVQVAAYRSQKVSVSGEVKTPEILPITDIPMTAERAVQLAGGSTPDADLRNVILVRAGKTYRLDLQALYENGNQLQNVLLRDGDTLQVTDRSQNKVFVLGEVSKSGALQMVKGRMTLADAIGESGGFSGASDPRRIYVIRGQLMNPAIYKLDGSSPTAMLMASQFQLMPKDVVYIAPSDVSRWSHVIGELLPSLTGFVVGTQLRR